MERLNVTYTVLKTLFSKLPVYYLATGGGSYQVFAVGESLVAKAFVANGPDKTDFDTNFKASAQPVSSIDEACVLGLGRNSVPLITARGTDGVPRLETSVRSGSKYQAISQNMCDKTTWYTQSTRHTDVQMVDSGDGLNFVLPTPCVVVDLTHGNLLHERRLRPAYAVVVKVDGTAFPEVDPHDAAGAWTMDYQTGAISFLASQAGKAITISYSQVGGSRWSLKPANGKRLRITSAELQFSTDAQMRDTFIFQMYATVDKFPPLWSYWQHNPLGAPGPYPTGTRIPIGDPVYYQNVFDLITEANLSYPVIPKWAGQGSTWRDLRSDCMVFSWDYGEQASIDVESQYGMEIEIRLEHDVQCGGSYSVITFYCVSEDT